VKTDSAEPCDGHAYLEGLSGFPCVHALERHDVGVITAVADLHMPLGRFYVVGGVDREPSCVRQKRFDPVVAFGLDGLPVFSGRGAKYPEVSSRRTVIVDRFIAIGRRVVPLQQTYRLQSIRV
jgi:hypothetical protein